MGGREEGKGGGGGRGGKLDLCISFTTVHNPWTVPILCGGKEKEDKKERGEKEGENGKVRCVTKHTLICQSLFLMLT